MLHCYPQTHGIEKTRHVALLSSDSRHRENQTCCTVILRLTAQRKSDMLHCYPQTHGTEKIRHVTLLSSDSRHRENQTCYTVIPRLKELDKGTAPQWLCSYLGEHIIAPTTKYQSNKCQRQEPQQSGQKVTGTSSPPLSEQCSSLLPDLDL
ncbi:hypothetical protein RRG08_039177 [Elysia crispata]|uniref:Uncharacterized protein n=1 Tax=Elysia crispata TaxID=231223 RepID=A0AAE0ZEB9_9GAST|nr:hypothetical protein RRG08_039177 [Elysia crispata]